MSQVEIHDENNCSNTNLALDENASSSALKQQNKILEEKLQRTEERVALITKLSKLREADMQDLQARYSNLLLEKNEIYNELGVVREILDKVFHLSLKRTECNIEKETVKLPVIRTIHHFACTGGTLFCKCIASMPNTQLIGEIAPLAGVGQNKPAFRFNPTDIIGQLCLSAREIPVESVIEIALGCIEAIYTQCSNLGRFLVLRDHTHTHYCRGKAVETYPTFLDVIKKKFTCRPLVTVRNPIDSYISLSHNKWISFSPQSFDEYCSRYLSFLKSYAGVPIIRYEDFVADPTSVMKNICHIYEIPFNPDFLDVFSVHPLTGDSGRKSDKIISRPRREIPEDINRQIAQSTNFKELYSILNY